MNNTVTYKSVYTMTKEKALAFAIRNGYEVEVRKEIMSTRQEIVDGEIADIEFVSGYEMVANPMTVDEFNCVILTDVLASKINAGEEEKIRQTQEELTRTKITELHTQTKENLLVKVEPVIA